MTRTPRAAFMLTLALLPAVALAQDGTADLETQIKEQRAKLDEMAAELEKLKAANGRDEAPGDEAPGDEAPGDEAPGDEAPDDSTEEEEESWIDQIRITPLPPTFEAADGTFKMQIRGRLQFDGRFIAEHGHPDFDNTFFVRRARLEFRGHLFGRLTFDAGLEFGRTSDADARNLFLNLEIHEGFQLRAGQMLVPFSDLRLTSSKYLNHMERTILVNQQVLLRDIGLQAWGNLFEDRLSWYIGAFNGEGQNLRADTDDDFDLITRLELRPFGDSTLSFSVNYAYTPPNRANTFPADAFTAQATPVVVYDPLTVSVRGHRQRFSGGFKYSIGPFEVKGEGGFDYYENAVSAIRRDNLMNWSYFIDASFILTGEDFLQGKDGAQVDPAAPLYDHETGELGLGAFQISVRFEDYYTDPATGPGAYTTTNADVIRVCSATLHWYAWKNVRLSVNYNFSHFQDGVVDSKGNRHIDEHAAIVRAGVYF